MNLSSSLRMFLGMGLVLSMIACGNESNEGEMTNAEKSTASALPVAKKASNAEVTGGLQWYTIEEAVEMAKKEPKLIFVDVYTDWCGWCKVMDKKTFTDAEVQKYIQENFYPVKFNAEQKETINFGGKEYKFVPGGRRGHNQLAAHLLNGRLGYPSFAYLSPSLKSLKVSPGYKKPDQLMAEMQQVVAGRS